MVMWSHVSEFLRFADDDVVSLGAEERAGGQLNLGAADYLHEFRLENGLPVWTYHVRGLVLEKRVLMLAFAEHRSPHLSHSRRRRTPAARAATRLFLPPPRITGKRGAG